MDAQMARKLAAAFPPDKVKQKRGQGGRSMSYISHGLITERLNDVDPEWSWRPLQTYTYQGPDGRLHCEGVEVELTIGGVSRVEAGGPQRQDGFANEVKNAYSDALKRAAMRFGVALSMWETLVDAEFDEDVNPDYQAQAQQPQPEARPAEHFGPGMEAGAFETVLRDASQLHNNGADYPKVFATLQEHRNDMDKPQVTRVKTFLKAIAPTKPAPAATPPANHAG